MTKKLVSLFLALVMAFSLTAAFAESTAVTVTDMAGREITLDAPATKVVALTASDCEILAALGAEDTLVGRGEYCDYPESVLEVPAVQSGADTNLEQIIALEPQVVIMAKMAQTEEQVAALEKAGIRVVVSDAQDIEGVYTAIRTDRRAGRPQRRSRSHGGGHAVRRLPTSPPRAKTPARPSTSRFLPCSGACGRPARAPSWMSWPPCAA